MTSRKKTRRKDRPQKMEASSAETVVHLGPVAGGTLPTRFLDETIAVFQPMSPRPLTREDAREIVYNMTGFFQVLSEWQAARDKRTKRPAPAKRGKTSVDPSP